ncbi:aspartic proteinase CDR1-like [Rosa rugosa]|uniref:aspartic proteinase CDR1-like n=1 Tax=Rosa rugosa TaxID=74645 RepID=UPI002B40798D|nr:aspartic proteinase CDR1-like [Rosa rugosa]
MAAFCDLHKNNYTRAVIAILLFHLIYCPVIAAANIDNNYGGFSAHLIRINFKNPPLHRPRHHKSGRRLIGPDTPQATLQTDPDKQDGHLMKLSVGTPAFDIYLAIDTGSTLLWTHCQPCQTCKETKHGMFDPKKSSTYKDVPCSAGECKILGQFEQDDGYCKDPKDTCRYYFEYLDTTFSTGVMAKETVTLNTTSGKAVTLKDILIGCAQEQKGATYTDDEMGIIGLGGGNLSFVSQIAPYAGGKKFSHCFVPRDADPNIESKINFGKGSEVVGEGVVSTPLLESRGDAYMIEVEGITIGNDFVPFNSTGTTMLEMRIDSGTPKTYIPQDFFHRVATQFMKTFDTLDSKLDSFISDDEKYDESHLCIEGTTIPKEPKVAINFKGGQKLQFTGEQIFFPNKDLNLTCFGMSNTTSQDLTGDHYGIYGGNIQRNFLIGFDLDKNVVSFKPTNCITNGGGAD